MMEQMVIDDYIFRGKRIDNGEWVEGWYHECTKGPWLDPVQNGAYIQTFEKLDNGEIILTGMFDVDPATVGMYTGLDDKNRNKVFKGDVLYFYNNINGNTWKCFCDFVNGCFVANYMDGTYIHFGAFHDAVTWETIGNIHDNPELLEASEVE